MHNYYVFLWFLLSFQHFCKASGLWVHNIHIIIKLLTGFSTVFQSYPPAFKLSTGFSTDNRNLSTFYPYLSTGCFSHLYFLKLSTGFSTFIRVIHSFSFCIYYFWSYPQGFQQMAKSYTHFIIFYPQKVYTYPHFVQSYPQIPPTLSTWRDNY